MSDSHPGTFLDGDRVTPGTEKCVCGSDCEFPCWQRLGLTTTPCCKGCAPLAMDDPDEGDGERHGAGVCARGTCDEPCGPNGGCAR